MEEELVCVHPLIWAMWEATGKSHPLRENCGTRGILPNKKYSQMVCPPFKYLEGFRWKEDWNHSELIPKGTNAKAKATRGNVSFLRRSRNRPIEKVQKQPSEDSGRLRPSCLSRSCPTNLTETRRPSLRQVSRPNYWHVCHSLHAGALFKVCDTY